MGAPNAGGVGQNQRLSSYIHSSDCQVGILILSSNEAESSTNRTAEKLMETKMTVKCSSWGDSFP